MCLQDREWGGGAWHIDYAVPHLTDSLLALCIYLLLSFASALAKKRVRMYCGGVFKRAKRIITPEIITEYIIYLALIKNKYI